MGAIFLKQPNGRYCRYSSIVDFVTHYNMTIEDVEEFLMDIARGEIKERLKDIENDKEKRGWFKSFQDMAEAMKVGVENGEYDRREYQRILKEMSE